MVEEILFQSLNPGCARVFDPLPGQETGMAESKTALSLLVITPMVLVSKGMIM
jgi:hypothetical protein